jgi:probable HAF family extracellular repeat protein
MKLPTLGGRGWNTPMAINNAGAVAGFSDLSGDVSAGVLSANFQAFLWTRDGGTRNLHTLAGDVLSEATGINDFGQIAGTSFDANFNPRVFLWQDGVMYDLNTLVQPDSPLYLLASGDINDRGVITGLACVVAGGACSSVLHTFVAIVAPAAAAAAASSGAQPALRPAVSAEVRARVLQQQRLGRLARGT